MEEIKQKIKQEKSNFIDKKRYSENIDKKEVSKSGKTLKVLKSDLEQIDKNLEQIDRDLKRISDKKEDFEDKYLKEINE